MAKKAWGEARLSPLEILLDRQNPRINVTSTDVENDIIKKLLKYEEVTDLAKKLAKGGLLPGERPIVVKENGQYVVLEGNRRICASKLLLNSELIPPEYRRGFPTITTADQLELLKKIKVDVSPDRRTAEPILTLRHTESGIKRWKPVARMRRVMRLLDEGFTVEQIAEQHQETPGKIRKTIKEFRLLSLAGQLKGLTKTERSKLEDPDLKTNPFTRFFDLSGVKEYLQLSFSVSGLAQIGGTRKQFDDKLIKIVRAFLNSADFDTRTDPTAVFGADFRKFKVGLAKPAKRKKDPKDKTSEPPPAPPPSSTPSPPRPATQPDRFFERLVCRIDSNQIASVVIEIKKITPARVALLKGDEDLFTEFWDHVCTEAARGFLLGPKGGDDLRNVALDHLFDRRRRPPSQPLGHSVGRNGEGGGLELFRGLTCSLDVKRLRMPSPQLGRVRLAVRIFVTHPKGPSSSVGHPQDEVRVTGVEPVLLRQRELVTCDPRITQSLLSILLRPFAVRFFITHDASPEISFGYCLGDDRASTISSPVGPQ